MRGGLLRLAFVTALGSIGLAAGGTAGALLVAAQTGSEAAAGLPIGLVVAGSAVGALGIGRITERVGRRRALGIGYAVGLLGALTVIGGAIAISLPLVLAGSLALGAANASVFLSRYAGASLGAEDGRGAAMGVILFATAAGAITGPLMLEPSAVVATALGLSEPTGLYLVAAVAFGLASVLLAGSPVDRAADFERRLTPGHLDAGGPVVIRALLLLAAANAAMVAIMAVAPVHLLGAGHGLGFVGLAIGVHVAGMLAPSPVTGWVVDRIGPASVAVGGGLLLVLGGIAGSLADHGAALPAVAFLLVLGLGWNGAMVGGSAMLTAALPPARRPRAEASGEVAMGVAAAIGAPLAGMLAAAGGFAALSLAGSATAILAIAAAWPGQGGLTSRRFSNDRVIAP